MKEGRTIQDLAAEIVRQAEAKRDFMTPTARMTMRLQDNADQTAFEPVLHLDGVGNYPLRQNAHRQLGQFTGIPAGYYDRMREHEPRLLKDNVNTWLGRSEGKRMVRTLDGHCRAFLSDRYRPLDNVDLAEAVLPIFAGSGLTVRSCEVTESRLYLKATNPAARAEVQGSRQVGDLVEAGVMISNSEIGAGALSVQPFFMRLVCINGMVGNDGSLRKTHTGRRQTGGDLPFELLRDETKRQTDKALWMQVGDLVRHAISQVAVEDQVRLMSAATADKIEGKVDMVIECARRRFDMTEGEAGSILRHLIEGADLSRWGLANAVTRASADVDSYDRATDLERIGGKIIELPKTDWMEIAVAS